MEEDEIMLVWAVLLCVRRENYRRRLSMWDTKTITLEEEGARFILELILSGNDEADMLEKVFGLPLTLQTQIHDDFRN